MNKIFGPEEFCLPEEIYYDKMSFNQPLLLHRLLWKRSLSLRYGESKRAAFSKSKL